MGLPNGYRAGKVILKAIGKTDGREGFKQDDYFFAKAICSTMSKSIALAAIYSSYREHDLVHKKLIDMVKTLTSQLDTTKLMHTIAEAGAQLVDAEMVCENTIRSAVKIICPFQLCKLIPLACSWQIITPTRVEFKICAVVD